MLEESPFCIKSERVFEALGTRQEGLSQEEAARRLKAYGPNTLREGRKKTLLGIIISQFKNLMILVLLAAAVLSLVIGHDLADAIIIFAVIILNAVMGTIQEAKAEAALESLKKLSAPSARVIRDGQVTTVPASELVVGDVVLLEAGDMCRRISGSPRRRRCASRKRCSPANRYQRRRMPPRCFQSRRRWPSA